MSPPKRQSVTRRGFVAAMAVTSAAAGAFALGVSPSIAAAAEALAGPATSFETWFDVEQPPDMPFEVIQYVVDFPLGARAPRHVNGGPAYITILDGEVTMWIGEAPARAYAAGTSFVEPFRVVAEAANLGPTPASLLATYLIPVGSTVSMPEGASTPPAGPLPPSPMVRFESRLRIDEALPYSQVGHVLLTYEPGARAASSGEPRTARLLTVVSGEVTVLTGNERQAYTADQHWIERPGQVVLSENSGNSPAVVAVSTTRG